MSTGGRPRVLLMHPILDPGPSILAEAVEVIAYPAGQPLDEASIRRAAEGAPNNLGSAVMLSDILFNH